MARDNTWEGFLPEKAILMKKKRGIAAAASLGKGPSAPATCTSSHPDRITPPEHLSDKIDNANPLPAQLALASIAKDLDGCTRCKLSCLGRTHIVVGEGNPRARLMFVGESPGEHEDLEGRPFVGKSGSLLDKMIEAIGLKRSDVFIANVVKCRPPDNREPEPEEIEACTPFLHRQIEAVRPEVIVALGKFAAQTLLQTETRISELRGHFHNYRGVKLMPTFHPAYLLHNPASKKEAWEDLKQVAQALGLAIRRN